MNAAAVVEKIQQARARGTAADLSGVDLRVESFHDADLSGANFSGANLSGTGFHACRLAGCNFHRAILNACKLDASDLAGCDLSEAVLGGATLSGCTLPGANLYAADLSGCTLDGCDLTGADLTRAVLDGARGSRVILCRAQLAGSRLRDAALEGCDLSEVEAPGANLSAARLHGCRLVKARLSKAELRDADLRGSDCSGADFYKAVLENAVLAGAVFAAAVLRDANLINADLAAADFSGADLRNADLLDAHAYGGRPPLLRGALYDDGTDWPDGLDWSAATFAKAERPRPPAGPRESRFGGLFARMSAVLARETPPRYTLPDRNVAAEEREIANRGYGLLLQVYEAFKHNRRLSARQKSSLKRQARRTLDNIITLLWNLSRVRGSKAVVRPESQAEIARLEEGLLAELKRSSEVLDGVLMSTLQLEITAGDRAVDRLLAELDESNQRMRELAEAYAEVKTVTRL